MRHLRTALLIFFLLPITANASANDSANMQLKNSTVNINIDSNKAVSGLIEALNKLSNKKPETDILYSLVLPALGAILLAILAPIIIEFAKNHQRKVNESKRLTEELRDIIRHCNKNIIVLKAINNKLTEGTPELFHYEKMKIPEDSLAFSLETFRILDHKKCRRIYELKLVLRNVNLNLDGIISYYQAYETDTAKITAFNNYIINHLGRVNQILKTALSDLNENYKKQEQATEQEKQHLIKKDLLNIEELIKLKDMEVASVSETHSLSREDKELLQSLPKGKLAEFDISKMPIIIAGERKKSVAAT